MQIPQSVARFNRHVTNPIQRLWAGRAPTFGILEHVGRKSGKTYRTPLTVFTTDDGVAILLTYGPDRDWLKNITAAGGGRITRRGQTFQVGAPSMTSPVVWYRTSSRTATPPPTGVKPHRPSAPKRLPMPPGWCRYPA